MVFQPLSGILLAAAIKRLAFVLQMLFLRNDFVDTSEWIFTKLLTHNVYRLAVENLEEIFWVSAPKNWRPQNYCFLLYTWYEWKYAPLHCPMFRELLSANG